MHSYWFVKDQSNMYLSLKNISVGVWPCMDVRFINVVTESNYSQCKIAHCMDTLYQLEKPIHHTAPLLSSHCFICGKVALF